MCFADVTFGKHDEKGLRKDWIDEGTGCGMLHLYTCK